MSQGPAARAGPHHDHVEFLVIFSGNLAPGALRLLLPTLRRKVGVCLTQPG